MKIWCYILIAYAFSLAICMAVMIHSRIQSKKGFRNGIGEDIFYCFFGAFFIPVLFYMALQELYYRNRPRPISSNLSKNVRKDMISYKGETMSLSDYNAKYNKDYTFEQVFGKKYVKSLSPEDLSNIASASKEDPINEGDS